MTLRQTLVHKVSSGPLNSSNIREGWYWNKRAQNREHAEDTFNLRHTKCQLATHTNVPPTPPLPPWLHFHLK